jgi:hypothetical protein
MSCAVLQKVLDFCTWHQHLLECAKANVHSSKAINFFGCPWARELSAWGWQKNRFFIQGTTVCLCVRRDFYFFCYENSCSFTHKHNPLYLSASQKTENLLFMTRVLKTSIVRILNNKKEYLWGRVTKKKLSFWLDLSPFHLIWGFDLSSQYESNRANFEPKECSTWPMSTLVLNYCHFSVKVAKVSQ